MSHYNYISIIFNQSFIHRNKTEAKISRKKEILFHQEKKQWLRKKSKIQEKTLPVKKNTCSDQEKK